MGNVVINDVKKAFGKNEILKGIDLEIKDGSFTIMLGPSGCGKSTMLRILSGLESVDEGSVIIKNHDVTNAEPKDRKVAMVFQNYALYPHMTAYKNVEYSLKVQKIDKATRKKKVMDALKTVGLEEQANKLPFQMSGGQRQRVALARAIVKKPEVFLMDEPLSNLDAKLRNQMRHSILELHKKLGTTFVYVTHDQTEAMSMGDNIVLMNKGVIVQQGSPKELYTNPNHIFVAGFIGNPAMNIIKMPFGYVGIRPENIKLEKMITEVQANDAIHLTAAVIVSEPLGGEILYDMKTSIGRIQVKAENTWGEEENLYHLIIPKDKILYFDEEGNRLYTTNEQEKVFLEMI